MANYSLVINSRFRPFEFDEMLKPVMMAEQAHREIENAYSDLYNQAATVDSMANEQSDPISYKRYKDYAADLKAQADELATNGLTPVTRKTMLDLKGRYTNEIVPIQNAYKRKAEQMKAQADILAKDPTHFFARTAANTSLDDYLNNATLDLTTQNYSGALLTQQVSNAASALAKDARNDPNVRTELRRLLPYQYETIRRTGFDPETVRQAILNSPNANKILVGLVDNALADSGISNWNYASPEDKERIVAQARNYANQGLWSAVGQTQYGNVSDTYGMQSALEAQRHSNAMQEARAKKQEDDDTNLPYRRIANTKVLETNKAKYENDLNFLRNLSKNGVRNLSRQGEVKSITSYESAIGNGGRRISEYDMTMKRFRDIAKEYGIKVDKWGPNTTNTLIRKVEDKLRQNIQRSQLYQVNMTDQSQIAKILQENSSTFSVKDRDRSGFNKIDDKGRVTKPLDADEAAEIFDKGSDFNVYYDPESGFQLNYRVGKKFETVNIEPELLNFGDDDYSRGHLKVNEYINKGLDNYATSLIDEMMTGLYYRFNTQAKKESTTDSDIE